MILFVEDEGSRVENDIEELRFCGYEVHLVTSVDQAIKFLEGRRSEIDGVICDVMMPHDRHFSAKETRDGLRTGVKLFEWVRARWPELPFVIFTNVLSEGLRSRFEDEPSCLYIEKRDFLGNDFIEQVQSLIPLPNKGGNQK